MMGKLLTLTFIISVLLYVVVKHKDTILPVAENGTIVVDSIIDKASDRIDKLMESNNVKDN